MPFVRWSLDLFPACTWKSDLCTYREKTVARLLTQCWWAITIYSYIYIYILYVYIYIYIIQIFHGTVFLNVCCPTPPIDVVLDVSCTSAAARSQFGWSWPSLMPRRLHIHTKAYNIPGDVISKWSETRATIYNVYIILLFVTTKQRFHETA